MIFSRYELSEIFGQVVAEDVDDVCINSNEVGKGGLFVALKGERTDGHNFIRQAIDNGAALVISEKKIPDTDMYHGKIIKVEFSLEALRKLAKYNVAKSTARCIGVTGSIGKTITKNLIYHILSSQPELQNKIYATRKNFNSQIGLPICAATMPRNTKFGIFEMGMSAFGEIKKLTDIVSPSVSVISQICEAHLESFNSVWDIAVAKSEIFETEKKQDAAIIPADSPYTDFLKQRAIAAGVGNIFTFCSPNADAKVIEYTRINDRLTITAEIFGEKIQYAICSSNIALINNSISSILCAHVISGVSLQDLADRTETFETPFGRGKSIQLKSRNVVIIDDSYNACPTSVKAAIRSLAQQQDRRKVLVIGDMLELGNDTIHYHENLSATVDKFGIDAVFACGPLAKRLFDNLRDCKKGVWCENSSELAKKILEEVQDGDAILIKGSNFMKMNYIVDAIKNLDETAIPNTTSCRIA
jgi:UDP-N-acetylmuramoyl-tripeptide--D-alanyl-D-alanine ligase